MIYGVDVSAYQPNFDFNAAAREGFDFAFIKATEGTGWKSGYYHDQMQRARSVGLLVAAYHYVRGSDVAGQLANIRAMVHVDTPVILDVEDGAGSISSIRELNAALNKAGYRTPLIYVPQWYWRDHMGSPDLRGLPPNWRSWYPDNTVRRKEAAVAAIPPRIWDELVGGIPTAVMQVTSSLAVANYPNGRIDGNAYRGTRDELAALLGGGEADDMPTVDEFWNRPVPVHPDADDPDQRTEVEADEAIGWTNKAAWSGLEETQALRKEFSEFKTELAVVLTDLRDAIGEIQTSPVSDEQLDAAVDRAQQNGGSLSDVVRKGERVAIVDGDSPGGT